MLALTTKRNNSIMPKRQKRDLIFGDIFEPMDQMFDSFFAPLFENPMFSNVTLTHHTYDSVKSNITDKDITIQFKVPGYSKNDLEVYHESGRIHVKNKASKKAKDDQEAEQLALWYMLPNHIEIDLDSLTSKCKDGILTVNAKFVKPIEDKSSKRIIKIE